MTIFEVIAISLSLLGYSYVVRKRRVGHAIWFVANCIWIAIDINVGLYGQAGLFGVYNAFCIWGFVSWKK